MDGDSSLARSQYASTHSIHSQGSWLGLGFTPNPKSQVTAVVSGTPTTFAASSNTFDRRLNKEEAIVRS